MSFLSGLQHLGQAYKGFEAQQDQAAQLRERQARAAQQDLQTKEFQADRASLAMLGEAFGAAPPQGPQPPPPGQASQPMPQGQPGPQMTPPGGMLPGGPPQGAAPGGAPPTPGPMPQGQPTGLYAPQSPQAQAVRAAGATPQGQAAAAVGPQQSGDAPPLQQGQPQRPQVGAMTLDQLRDRILQSPKNRELIQKDPSLLIRTLMKGQALLAPEAKAELAQAKQELAAQALNAKIDQAQQKLDQSALSIDDKRKALQDANQLRLQIAQLQDTTKRSALEDKMVALEQRLQSNEKIAAGHDKTKAETTATTEAGKTARAQTMNLGKLTQMATKAGVTITDDMDVGAIQKATADKIAQAATDKKMDPDTVQFMARSIVQDPSLISRIGRNDVNRKEILDALAKQPGIDEGTLASAKVALGEKTEAGRVVGRIEGSTRQALEEMAPFSKLVRESAAKVDNGKYPTVNAIVQAAKRGTGDPNVVSLGNNIQALKNAFVQSMVRGGQTSVNAQKRADELIGPTMAPAQLDAAIVAMNKEAEGILGAAERATKGIAAEAGGKKAEPPAAASALPKGLPDAKGHAEGSTAKDKTGKVVAVIKDGAWAEPP